MRKYILVGYSGHSYVVIDTIRSNGDVVLGYFRSEEKERNPYGLEWLGDEREEEVIRRFAWDGACVALATGNNTLRRKLYDHFDGHGIAMPTVRNRDSWVSDQARIGEACFVAHGCQVNALSEIGKGTILNTDTIIEHECVLGAFSNVAPGAVLLGNVTVEEGAFVGANAVIHQGVTIHRDAVVGMGSVVLKDVPAGEVWAGNPARPIRNEKSERSVAWWQKLIDKLNVAILIVMNELEPEIRWLVAEI